ncbi:unnamed protein product [Pedinophyceae sp. YPF-701]|nr:unnamed protein product [Pedinophyceae sp. YPF-701]
MEKHRAAAHVREMAREASAACDGVRLRRAERLAAELGVEADTADAVAAAWRRLDGSVRRSLLDLRGLAESGTLAEFTAAADAARRLAAGAQPEEEGGVRTSQGAPSATGVDGAIARCESAIAERAAAALERLRSAAAAAPKAAVREAAAAARALGVASDDILRAEKAMVERDRAAVAALKAAAEAAEFDQRAYQRALSQASMLGLEKVVSAAQAHVAVRRRAAQSELAAAADAGDARALRTASMRARAIGLESDAAKAESAIRDAVNRAAAALAAAAEKGARADVEAKARIAQGAGVPRGRIDAAWSTFTRRMQRVRAEMGDAAQRDDLAAFRAQAALALPLGLEDAARAEWAGVQARRRAGVRAVLDVVAAACAALRSAADGGGDPGAVETDAVAAAMDRAWRGGAAAVVVAAGEAVREHQRAAAVQAAGALPVAAAPEVDPWSDLARGGRFEDAARPPRAVEVATDPLLTQARALEVFEATSAHAAGAPSWSSAMRVCWPPASGAAALTLARSEFLALAPPAPRPLPSHAHMDSSSPAAAPPAAPDGLPVPLTEAAVRRAVSRGKLAVPDCGLTSLGGVSLLGRCCPDAASLDVSGNPLGSLNGVAALTKLRELAADRCGLTSLADVRQMTCLRVLSASGNPLGPQGPDVAQLSSLRSLALSNCGIASLDLSACLELSKLDVSRNRLKSLHGLTACTALVHLDVSRNELMSLEGIEAFPILQVLVASRNRLDAFPPLRSPLLKELALSGNCISCVPPLPFLPHLADLRLDDNDIVSVAPLRGLPSLRTLILSFNGLADAEQIAACLAHAGTLSALQLNDNPVAALPGYRERMLAALPWLRELDHEPARAPGGLADALSGGGVALAVQRHLARQGRAPRAWFDAHAADPAAGALALACAAGQLNPPTDHVAASDAWDAAAVAGMVRAQADRLAAVEPEVRGALRPAALAPHLRTHHRQLSTVDLTAHRAVFVPSNAYRKRRAAALSAAATTIQAWWRGALAVRRATAAARAKAGAARTAAAVVLQAWWRGVAWRRGPALPRLRAEKAQRDAERERAARERGLADAQRQQQAQLQAAHAERRARAMAKRAAMAATRIQAYARGWLVRKRLRAARERARYGGDGDDDLELIDIGNDFLAPPPDLALELGLDFDLTRPIAAEISPKTRPRPAAGATAPTGAAWRVPPPPEAPPPPVATSSPEPRRVPTGASSIRARLLARGAGKPVPPPAPRFAPPAPSASAASTPMAPILPPAPAPAAPPPDPAPFRSLDADNEGGALRASVPGIAPGRSAAEFLARIRARGLESAGFHTPESAAAAAARAEQQQPPQATRSVDATPAPPLDAAAGHTPARSGAPRGKPRPAWSNVDASGDVRGATPAGLAGADAPHADAAGSSVHAAAASAPRDPRREAHEAKLRKLMQEWGFQDLQTAEHYYKARRRQMKQKNSLKSAAKLKDPQTRLNMLRKHLEDAPVPMPVVRERHHGPELPLHRGRVVTPEVAQGSPTPRSLQPEASYGAPRHGQPSPGRLAAVAAAAAASARPMPYEGFAAGAGPSGVGAGRAVRGGGATFTDGAPLSSYSTSTVGEPAFMDIVGNAVSARARQELNP